MATARPPKTMENFPDDIILHIFSFLRKTSLCLAARLTCTRWWNISKDATLWKNVTVPIHFTDKRLTLLMEQVGNRMEELDCSQCEALSTEVFLNLKNGSMTTTSTKINFPNLKQLSLPVEPIDSVAYTDVNSYFTELSKLFPYLENLENMTSVSGTVNALECQSIFPNLKVLNDKPTASFGRISEVVRRGVQQKKDSWMENITKLSRSCPKITEYRCTKGAGYLDHTGLAHLGAEFPRLDVLELRLCSLDDDALLDYYKATKDKQSVSTKATSEFIFEKPGKITDKGLGIIAANSPELKKIKLSRCSDITHDGINNLTAKCKGLLSLHINTSRGWGSDSDQPVEQIDDDCIRNVAENCKDLQIFRMLYSSKISTQSIISLHENCIKLSALMFFECSLINDTAVEQMSKMPFLRRLVLVNTNVSPKGVLYFILDAPCLTSLTLYCSVGSEFNTDLSDLGEEIYNRIDAESSNYRPNALHSLTLRGVGSGFMQLITVLSPNLLSLDIRDGYTTGISTTSLKSVLINCEILEQLDVSSLNSVDPSFLTSLAESAKSLRKLSLGSNVKNYENTNFDAVIRDCACLEMLSMDTYSSKIDEAGLVELVKGIRGGYCYVHIDRECEKDVEFKHRFISLHFTPVVYLGSILCPK